MIDVSNATRFAVARRPPIVWKRSFLCAGFPGRWGAWPHARRIGRVPVVAHGVPVAGRQQAEPRCGRGGTPTLAGHATSFRSFSPRTRSTGPFSPRTQETPVAASTSTVFPARTSATGTAAALPKAFSAGTGSTTRPGWPGRPGRLRSWEERGASDRAARAVQGGAGGAGGAARRGVADRTGPGRAGRRGAAHLIRHRRALRARSRVDVRSGGAILNNRLSTIIRPASPSALPGAAGTGDRRARHGAAATSTEVAITKSGWRIERLTRQEAPAG
jgi:hypothetical protein